jgi:hypothetical protein
MAKFKLSNFGENVRVCLSRKKIIVPPVKKFTIERLNDPDRYHQRSENAHQAFSVLAPISIIMMFVCIALQIGSMLTKTDHKDILDFCQIVTFTLSLVTLIICFFNKYHTMYKLNIGLWIFNCCIWGMAAFNIWVYKH